MADTPPKLVRLFFFLTATAMNKDEIRTSAPLSGSLPPANPALPSPPQNLSTPLPDQRGALDKSLSDAKLDADARRVLVEKMKLLPDDEFVATLAGLDRTSPEIIALDEKIENGRSGIAKLEADGFDPGHPRVVSLKAEVDAEETQRHQLVDGLHRAMDIDLQMADSRVALLQKELDQSKSAAGD